MMCDCRSYNKPEFGGTTPERVLPYARFFSGERETVCVDECIADAIMKLWMAGVRTEACCCGHNGQRNSLVTWEALSPGYRGEFELLARNLLDTLLRVTGGVK